LVFTCVPMRPSRTLAALTPLCFSSSSSNFYLVSGVGWTPRQRACHRPGQGSPEPSPGSSSLRCSRLQFSLLAYVHDLRGLSLFALFCSFSALRLLFLGFLTSTVLPPTPQFPISHASLSLDGEDHVFVLRCRAKVPPVAFFPTEWKPISNG